MPRLDQVHGGGPSEPNVPETQQTLKMIQDLLNHMIQQQQHNQANHSAEDPSERFLKLVIMIRNLGLRKFKGDLNTVFADAWIKELETNFEMSRCSEEFRRPIVVNFLEEDARAWWDSVVPRYRFQTISWEIFWREFEQKYFPPESRDRLENQFLRLKQGDMTVRAYGRIFTRLQRYLYQENDDELAMARRFFNRLRPDIKGRLHAVTYQSVAEVEERAVSVEEAIETEKEITAQERKKEPVQQEGESSSRTKLGRRPWALCDLMSIKADQTERPNCEPCPDSAVSEGTPSEEVATPANVFALGVEPPKLPQAAKGPITGTLLVGGNPTHVLFDSGVSNSFVTPEVANKFGDLCEEVEVNINVYTASNQPPLKTRRWFKEVSIVLQDTNLPVNPLVMPLERFDAILGMDWLSEHQAHIDCSRNRVLFENGGRTPLVFNGISPSKTAYFASAARIGRSFDEDDVYLVNLTAMGGDDKEGMKVEDTAVVKNYEDVFRPLEGLPPPKEPSFYHKS
ncbi:PREDICTED: uncharacterized protein LOC104789490 [Camelina sativa]|uniref:Uncharacterized protein LOC104789490 n=1 Tax=Camelina sativa TaxID=90675 RepID=A0ABM0ZBW6_CAMSA|nr:PREDICTED: uncharacterized protein LOC104789490 [Camelina sativa]